MGMRVELVGEVDPCVDLEDGGRAMVARVVGEGSGCGGMFVRLQSWDEAVPVDDRHRVLQGFLGRRVRVTVEVLS